MREPQHTSLIIGLMNWLTMIRALMERDIATRFSGGSLGHAWAVIIPVSWILAITLFFRWLGRDAPIPVSLPVFLATGMLPYLVFRQIITSMMRALKSNRHLVTLGPAQPEDIFTATAALELINAAMTAAVVLCAAALWTGLPGIHDPLTAVWGFALACGFGIALGRFAAILALISDSAMRLTPIVLRPFFWLSGIFFVAAEVPQWALAWLWYNPLFHAIEIMRSGFFLNYQSLFATSFVPIIAIATIYMASRIIQAYVSLQPGRGVLPA